MPLAVQVEALWNGLRDNSGQPLAGGKVYSYSAGTLSNKTLYTAVDKSGSASNPLILDAYGRAQVWADGAYKFVIKDANDNTLQTLDNLRYGYDDGELLDGGSAAGTGNAQTITAGSISAYANGQRFTYKATATNTGATTLNVNGIGAKSIVKGVTPSALAGGEIQSGQVVEVVYDTGGSGRFRLLSVTNETAVARVQYPTTAQVQDSSTIHATTGGSSNTYTLTLAPAITAYTTGQTFVVKPNHANSGAATININSLGAKAIQYMGNALVGGEILTTVPAILCYDGTQFQLLNHAGGWASYTPTIGVNGALTLSASSVLFAKYQRHGKRIDFIVQVEITASATTSSGAVTITHPINPDGAQLYGALACHSYNGSENWLPHVAEYEGSAVFILRGSGSWTSGQQYRVSASGSFQTA